MKTLFELLGALINMVVGTVAVSAGCLQVLVILLIIGLPLICLLGAL